MGFLHLGHDFKSEILVDPKDDADPKNNADLWEGKGKWRSAGQCMIERRRLTVTGKAAG